MFHRLMHQALDINHHLIKCFRQKFQLILGMDIYLDGKISLSYFLRRLAKLMDGIGNPPDQES